MSHSSTTHRDSWKSNWGFVLACIGSAVGMGNIWMFPTRVSKYGGGTFLLPYFLFVIIIGLSGVIGEMAFGRATRSGPIGAFGQAIASRGKNPKIGQAIGYLPVIGSLALAIGYSVIVGWILKYAAGSLTGSVLAQADIEGFGQAFGQMAAPFGNNFWQTVGIVITFIIMVCGISGGIEKINKVIMPLFFFLFLGLAVYMAFQPGAAEGYRYIFRIEPEGLADPMTWVFALGQAFFSLSLAGNGTLIYGLAAVIIGEALFGKRGVTVGLISAVCGSVIYKLIVTFVVDIELFGTNSANLMKLMCAVIVAATFIIPAAKRTARNRKVKKEARRNA